MILSLEGRKGPVPYRPRATNHIGHNHIGHKVYEVGFAVMVVVVIVMLCGTGRHGCGRYGRTPNDAYWCSANMHNVYAWSCLTNSFGMRYLTYFSVSANFTHYTLHIYTTCSSYLAISVACNTQTECTTKPRLRGKIWNSV